MIARGAHGGSWSSGAPPDVVLAVLASTVTGVGLTLVMGGAGANRLDLLAVGGALAGAGLVILLAAGWLAGVALVALTLPLPPVYDTGGLRLAAPLLATALAVGGWLLRPGTVWGTPTVRRRIPHRAVVAFVAVTVLSALFAQARLPAARELVNVGLFVGLLYLAVDELRDSPDRVHRLALLLAGVVGAAGAVAGMEAAGLIPGRFPLADSLLQRAAGGFGWPNELGVFFTVGLPFAVYAMRCADSPVARVAGVATALLAGAGLLSTFSRGNWLGTLLAPAVLLLAGEGRWVLRFLLAALLTVVAAEVVTGGAVQERVMAAFSDPSALQRLALMGAGVLMLADHPFTGVGPGGFGEALEEYGTQVPGLWDFVGSAHNAYIHIAAETGLPGLVALLWLLGAVGWTLLRSARRTAPGSRDRMLAGTLLWAFAAVCAAGLFEWILVHGIGQLVMMVAAMGLALATWTEGRAEASGVP